MRVRCVDGGSHGWIGKGSEQMDGWVRNRVN